MCESDPIPWKEGSTLGFGIHQAVVEQSPGYTETQREDEEGFLLASWSPVPLCSVPP